MNYTVLEYLDWYKTQKPVHWDLRKSGVPHLSLKEALLDGREWELSGPNFYGFSPLVEAVGERYSVPVENIVSTLGTTQALYLIAAAVLEEGDEVLVEQPTYEPLSAVPAAFGARVVRFSRAFDKGYGFEPEEVEALLTEKTRMVVLSNLHNPSGIFTTETSLRKLAVRLEERGIYLVVDEVYREAVRGQKGKTVFHSSKTAVSISSLNKVFGLGGLRCGWALAPRPLVIRMYSIIDYLNGENVFIGEKIASELFPRLDSIKQRHESRIDTNRKIVAEMIRSEKNLDWVEPDAGIICFPRLKEGIEGNRFVEILRDEYQTAVVPGRFFDDSHHFRLGFGGDTETLIQGLNGIRSLLKRYP